MQLLHQRQEVPLKAMENMPTGDVLVSWPHVCAYACVWERKSVCSVVMLAHPLIHYKMLRRVCCPQSEFSVSTRVCVCPYEVINANISSFLLRNKPPSSEETEASEQMDVLTRLFEL